MMLKVPNFIWQQKGIRHELIINREKPLKSANNDTKYVFLSEVVH